MQRLRCLVWKEFLELRQNPRLFGLVDRRADHPADDARLRGDDGREGRAGGRRRRRPDRRRAATLIARFDASPNFTVIDTVRPSREVDPYLQRGRAWLALAIPHGLRRAIRCSEQPVALQVVADGTDSNSTTVALGYATALIGEYAQELVVAARPRPAPLGGTPARSICRMRVWFNPQLESRFFMIPGVLALLLLLVTANLAAMAIVREKELGTLEQLNVTPLRRWELIVGKLLPYGVIALIDVLLVTAVAVFWFEVPLRGSFCAAARR